MKTESKKRLLRTVLAAVVLFTGPATAQVGQLELLARKFAPILILTEETGGLWGDIRVTKPEPVEIAGADSAANIWRGRF